MDDELVKLYNLLVREGYYTKTLEDFVFKYVGEPEYKEKVFDVVSRDGFYTKSKEEFFDQYKLPDTDVYKDLYTVKKKDDAIPSVSSDGDSTYTEQVDAEEPYIDYLQKDPFEGTFLSQEKDPISFEERTASITKDIIQQSEEFTVPQMNYNFNKFGFTFEEAGAGNAMNVTSSNGQTLSVDLGWEGDEASLAEAEKLQEFLKINRVQSEALNDYTSQFSKQKAIIRNEEELKRATTIFNDITKQYKADIDSWSTRAKELRDEYNDKYIGLTEEQINADADLKAEYEIFVEKDIALQQEYADLVEREEYFKDQGKRLDRMVGNYVEMQSLQGNWGGGIWNSALSGVGSMSAGQVSMMTDFIVEFFPTAAMGADGYTRGFIRAAETLGYSDYLPEGAEDMTVEELRKAMDISPEEIERNKNWAKEREKRDEREAQYWRDYEGDTTNAIYVDYLEFGPPAVFQDETGVRSDLEWGWDTFLGVPVPTHRPPKTIGELIEDKAKDDAKKATKFGEGYFRNPYSFIAANTDPEMGLVDATRAGARELFGDKETTEQWRDMQKESFWGGAILGLAESLPAMVGGNWAQRTANMYALTTDQLNQEMEGNPDFDDISESEKYFVTAPVGVAVASLEAFGFRNVINQKGLLNGVIMRALGRSTKSTSAKTFSQFIKEDVESMMARGILTVGAGGLAEFETGAAQQAAEITIKEIYNTAKGKDMFQTPNTWIEFAGDVLQGGAQEAIGGFVLATPGAIVNAVNNKEMSLIDDDSFNMLKDMSGDAEFASMYGQSLRQKVSAGEMTEAEAKQKFDDFNRIVAVTEQIPTDLNLDDQKKALELLVEKQNLYEQINGRDKSLVKDKTDRVKEIDAELASMSERKNAAYMRDGRFLSRDQFIEQLEAATPEEIKEGSWQATNDSEVTDLLANKISEIEQGAAVEEAPAEEAVVEEAVKETKAEPKKRVPDNTVPVKREVIKVTSEDGEYTEHTVTTMLDGSLKSDAVSYDKNGNEVSRSTGEKLADNDIIQRDGLTALDAVMLGVGKGDVVTVESTQSGTEFINPKKIDRLTPEQKAAYDAKTGGTEKAAASEAVAEEAPVTAEEFFKEEAPIAEAPVEFSQEDQAAILDINTEIRDLSRQFGVAETVEEKQEARSKLVDARTRKAAIESKYLEDVSKEEAGVPSTQQEGQAVVEGEPIEEAGVEEVAADRDVQAPEEEVAPVVAVAPFFNTTVESVEDAAALREDENYTQYKNNLSEVGNQLGIEVEVQENIGGYKNDAGEEIIEISNRVVLPGATLAQAEEYASLVAALAPETQESTIAAQYVEDGSDVQNGNEYIVKVSDIQGALNALNAAGITDFSINENTGEVSFFDIFDFSDPELQNKIGTFVKNLQENNIDYEGQKYRPIQSNFIDKGTRKEILGRVAKTRSELRQDGTELYRSILKAIENDASFQGLELSDYTDADLTQLRELSKEALAEQPTTGRRRFPEEEMTYATEEEAMAAAEALQKRLDVEDPSLLVFSTETTGRRGKKTYGVDVSVNLAAAEETAKTEPTEMVVEDVEIKPEDIVSQKDAEGNVRFFAAFPIEGRVMKSFFEVRVQKDGTIQRVSDKSYGPARKTLKRRLLAEAPTKPKSRTKQQLETSSVDAVNLSDKAPKMIEGFNKAIKSIGGKPVSVYVVSNSDMQKLTGSSSRAQFRTLDDGSSAIIVNADKASLGSLSHEMMHAYVKAVNLSPKQIIRFTNEIRSQLSKGNAQEKRLARDLTEFQKEYLRREVYGKGLTLDDAIIAEEFLAEFVAKIKDGINIESMSLSTIERIRKAVVRILNDILGLKIDDTAIKSKEEAFDFINGFLDALEGRVDEDVAPTEEQGESGQVGTISIPREQIKVIDAPKASDDPRGFVNKFVTDINIKDLDGRKFVTNMYDYTSAGVTQLGNGISIELLGGRNYVPLMLERNGKELGEVSNLAAFNSKSQAEGFIRNAKEGKADLFAPHSGTLTDSWQFQHHIFEELVKTVLDNKIMSKARLMEVFNEAIKSKEGTKAFNAFNEKNNSKLRNLNSFKKDPMKLVELLNAENNYSPNLRKALNQKIAASKEFQSAIGIKNLNQFYNLIADPLNQGVEGGEVMTFVEFDPNTFEISKTKPGDPDHHPSFGWTVKAKIKRILQPNKYYKSYDLTNEYTKYNVFGPEVSTKADPKFAVSNVTSSAGAIPKVAKVDARQQIDWQPSLFGKGQVNPAIVNRSTPVQEAALDLLQGKISNAEYQETVRITQPVEPITRFFLPASTKDMREALDSNKGKILNTAIEDGKEVGLRLDIPAYKNRNIWVVSVHDSGKAGKSISYGSVAWATDVQFGSNPKVAAFIAAGKNIDTGKKQDKTTIARMHGKWKNFDGKTKEERDASAVEKVEEIVAIENSYPGAARKGSPWRQIGMNPFRHSYFYDRRTGKPVVAASEVVQIGGLVYAKDVVYADKNDPVFEVQGYKDSKGETVRFQIEDQVNQEKNSEETYSAINDNKEGVLRSQIDDKVDQDVAASDTWKSRERNAFERFVDLTRRRIQDSYRDIIVIQEDIEYATGKPVGLDQDFRNAEVLMHGKAKSELNKTEDRIKDITSKIKKSGLSVDDVNELLYAMHAQERNRYLRTISTDIGKSLSEMRKKNGMTPTEVAELLGISKEQYLEIEANKRDLKSSDLTDLLLIYGSTPYRFFYDNALVKDGSGMTDVEARKILAKYDLNLTSPDVSQLSPKIRPAVTAIRELIADTRDRLVESGLESQGTIDAFNATYKNYVPLRGFADEQFGSEFIEGGGKLEVRAKERRAKGRQRKADSPLTQAIISNTTTIIRGAKNDVMKRFYELAKDNPNKDIYEVVDPEKSKDYKTSFRNGKVIAVAKSVSDYLLDENMVSVRIDGDYKFIRFKDAKLANALRGANTSKAEWLTKYVGKFNRTLSSLITTYDPEFVLRNFSRDIQTAVMNLYAEQDLDDGLIKDKNIVGKTVKDVFPALKTIFAVEGGWTGKKEASRNKDMDQYYKEFLEDGAKTEWFYSKPADQINKDIEKLMSGKGDGAFKAAGSLIERVNSSVENAVRLSAYVNARKAGISRAKAAELAKNLTVNFNKSGEWGQVGNTLYLFFNASVQGSSRLLRSLKPAYKIDGEGNRKYHLTRAQKMAVGLYIMGNVLSLFNGWMSDEDEDGESFYSKIPEFEKERNIIIMKPNGRDYWKIPLPYGANTFYVAGSYTTEALQGTKTPGQVASAIGQAAIGSFSPINFPTSKDASSFLVKFVTPTVGQIPVSLAINENYFGEKIYRENFPFDPAPKPQSQLGKESGYRWTQAAVKWLNEVTGGSEYRSGYIDINPDRVDFVIETLTGGAGKFTTRSANTIDKIVTGNWDELEPRQIPFVRVFNGQPYEYSNVSDFYDRTVDVNQKFKEVKAGIIKGADAKKIYEMHKMGKDYKSRLKKISKLEDEAAGIKDPLKQEARLDQLEKARYKLVADFNKRYIQLKIEDI